MAQFRELKKLSRELEIAEKRALPDAARWALNQTAFEAMRDFRGSIGTEFVTRNRFTQRSVVFNKTKGSNVSSMFSRTFVGKEDADKYLALQNEGGISRGKSGQKIIPTAQARVSGSNTKPVGKPNYASRLTVGATAKAWKHARRAARRAISKGSKVIRVTSGKTDMIFRVGRMGKRKTTLKPLINLNRPEGVRIKKTGIWTDVVTKRVAKMPRLLDHAIKYQLKKRHVLGF